MDQDEAKRRHKKAPILLLARRFFAVIVGFSLTVIVARLVGPEAYGLATMSLVLFNLSQAFRDFGLTQAMLRKGAISREERTFLFWFNIAATTAVASVLLAISPFAAQFYNEPLVMPILWISVIGFWAGGAALQHRSLLIRSMRFGEIAWIDAAAITAQFITTITLALIRPDVWCIVWGNVASSTVSAVLNVWRSGFIPGPPRKMDGAGELLRFGANTTINTLCTFITTSAGPLLIGRFLGADALGQYSRGHALYALPAKNLVEPIVQATTPLLTHLRPNPDAYREAYLRLIRTLSTVLTPAAVVLTFSAGPVAATLLGAQWGDAGVVLSCLAPTLGIVGLTYSISDLFVTQNRSSELRTLGLVEAPFRVLAIFVGVQFGLAGVSLAYTLSTVAVCIGRVVVAGRSGPVTARDQFTQLLPAVPIAAGCAAGSLAALFALANSSQPAPLEAIGILSAGALGGLVSLALSASSRQAVLEVLRTFGLPVGLRRKLVRKIRSDREQ